MAEPTWPPGPGAKEDKSGRRSFPVKQIAYFKPCGFGVVQVSDDWILTPRFQGRQLDMPVVVIILSVILGGAFLGLFGMLLAVPFTACVKIYWQEVLRERLLAYADRH